MTQEQKSKAKGRRPEAQESAQKDVRNEELAEATAAVLDDVEDVLEAQLDDELLAAMDDVLEENAREFVDNFVQEGGE